MYYLCNSTSVQIGPLENFFHQLHLFFYFQGRLKPQVIVHSTLKFFSKKKMIFKENYSSNVMNMNIKYETNNYTLMLFSPGDQFSQCQICFFQWSSVSKMRNRASAFSLLLSPFTAIWSPWEAWLVNHRVEVVEHDFSLQQTFE